jgi:lambda family phage portal protein
MNIRGALSRLLPSSKAPAGRALQNGRPQSFADYMRGGVSPFMFGWRPVLRDAREDVLRSWTDAAARSIDAMHNSGFLAGGVEQAVANIVGTGLRLNATPDPELFGGQTAANKWARDVEAKYRDWASHPWSCDLGGRYTIAQLSAQGLRSYFATGEQVATLPYVERPGSSHGTKLNLMPSSRLAQGGATADVVQGVRLDRNGAPTGYVFLNRDNATATIKEVEVRARDPEGRPQVLHIFDGLPTATRGISPLAPALQVIRQIDQLQNATLTSALIQAIFTASIESDAPTEEVLEALRSQDEQDGTGVENGVAGPANSSAFDSYMSNKFKWYGESKIDLGQFGKIFHAFPGEKLDFKTANHPNANYKDFMKMLQREVARCLGITYEGLSLDNEGATYSSLNNETADIYLITEYRRVYHAAPLYQGAYETWLEEAIERGEVTVPGGMDNFLDNRRRFCRAEWEGPPRPAADEKKTAEANEVKLRNKVISRQRWASDLGGNVFDVDAQERQEQDNREALDLPPVTPVTNTTPNQPDGGRTGGEPDTPPEPGSGDEPASED